LYRLASFADSVLLPCLKARSETWDQACLVEAFLWLDLGVKIDAFHEEAAQGLASHAAEAVSNAIAALERVGVAQLIPDHTREMLLRGLSDRSWFQRETMGYTGGGNLVPYFDSALLHAVGALRDPQLEQLFVELHFADARRWDAVAEDRIDIEMISALEDVDSRVEITTGARMVALVTSCLGRWSDAERFVRELRDSELDIAARIGLAGDIASIQSWRFGFSNERARQRILDAVRRAANVMWDASGDLSDDRQATIAAVIEELTDMMSRWEKHAELQLDDQFAGV
jgi:hypothetical protein